MLCKFLKNITHKNFKKFRLRTVLIVPFIIPIIAATGLVGWFSFRNGQQAINDLAIQLNREISARINQHVLDYLNKSHNVHRLTYAGIQSGNFQLNDFEGLQRYFWQVVQNGDLESYLSFGNEQGEFVGVERREDGTIQLKIRTRATEPIRETYLLDNQGNRQKPLKGAEYDPRTRPWYKAAKQAGKPTWSPIYPFSSRQNRSLGISPVRPVYDANGRLLGVLNINITLMRITDFLKNLHISPHGQSFIMERSGDLVVSSMIAEPFIVKGGKGDEREIERMPAAESQNATVTATAEYLQQHFGSFTAINSSQNLKFQIGSAWYYVQVMPIQDGRSIDWLAVVVVPEADFMERINANTRSTILLCLVTLAVATVIGILTAGWISRQIFKLNKASQEIASGNFNPNVEVQGIVELEKLAGSFNSMAAQLNESFTALQIAEENYRSIFENALEGIFQASPDGRFIDVNLAMTQIYGYESSEEMLNSLAEMGKLYVDPNIREEFKRRLEECGKVQDWEYQIYRKDGSIIWLKEDTRAVRNPKGQLLYYEGLVQDITQRKQQEERLKRQLQELQIEIDHQKRQREVALITQSDYFQEMQAEITALQVDEFWES